jgi:hypothetical protein
VRTLVLLIALSLMVACQNHDIGADCPDLEVTNPGGVTEEGDVERSQGQQAVEFNTLFPCNSTACVATLGRGSYCSEECASNVNCPDGFSCEHVITAGPFTERKFCVWKICNEDADCGDPWTVECALVPELSVEEPVKQCRWRD